MIVYKFGGASVQSASGVKNLESILKSAKIDAKIVVVVSAMGKTTNALERLLHESQNGNSEKRIEELNSLKKFHFDICSELNLKELTAVNNLFTELENSIIKNLTYDKAYDKIVSFGEMLSTTIISEYLNSIGLKNLLIDMRNVCVTDDKHREANVDFEATKTNISLLLPQSEIFIVQGFIGGTKDGVTTTLGREGSDYTAAVVANIIDAESVTIWKDVNGILNADPRIFNDTTLIEKMSYIDAVELAHSGAQIIHPKTIKPLENKKIPLYVKPFLSPESCGSVICETSSDVDVPIYIVKPNQTLITINPLDFSFVLEESLPHIFTLLNNYRQKVGMMQSSAIKVSVSVDNSPYFNDLISALKQNYKVRYNNNLELITIRGNFTQEHIDKIKSGKTTFVEQRTRRSYKLLYLNYYI